MLAFNNIGNKRYMLYKTETDYHVYITLRCEEKVDFKNFIFFKTRHLAKIDKKNKKLILKNEKKFSDMVYNMEKSKIECEN
jgi:hypothetical protein